MYRSVCDVYHHHWILKGVAEIVLVKQRQTSENDRSTLVKSELRLENNACNVEMGKGEKVRNKHVQDDNSHSGKYGKGRLKTPKITDWKGHTVWRSQGDRQVRI